MTEASDDLRRLREQVYGRDPDPAAVARYAAALAEAARTAPSEPDPEQPPARASRTRLPLLAGAGAVLLVGAAVVATGVAPRPQPIPSATATTGSLRTSPIPVAIPAPSPDSRTSLREQVLGDPAHLAAQDYFAFYPIDLPQPFGIAGAPPVSYPNLHGTADLTLAIAPKATQALVLVTCADHGVAYAWTVLGRYAPNAAPLVVGHGGGSDCHSLDSATVPLSRRLSDVHLVVTVPDDVLFAVSIYQH